MMTWGDDDADDNDQDNYAICASIINIESKLTETLECQSRSQ